MTVTAAKRRPAIPTPLPSLVPPVDETSNLRRAKRVPEPSSSAPAETLTPGHGSSDTQAACAGDPLASGQCWSDDQAPTAAGNQLTPGQTALGTHPCRAGEQLTPGHEPRDTQSLVAGGQLASGQGRRESQTKAAAGNPLTPGHGSDDTQTTRAGGHLDGELLFYAALLDDIEDLRKRTANRARALAAEGATAAEYERHVEAFAGLEHQAVLHLQRAMRKHPYAPWVKQTLGVGEKQGARLLAAIGDPYWNAAEGRPRRGPAELWAYCGYAPGQKRQKGVKANWNAEAKMRAFLVAEKCLNTGVRKLDGYDDTDGYDFENRVALTPHAQVYLDARRAWADRDTSEGHKHNHALRRVAKEVLKDLWRFGRDLEESA